MKTKKGFEIGDMLPIGITLVVFGIAIAYGLQIIGEIGTDMTDTTGTGCNTTDPSGCGYDYNATQDTLSGVSKLPDKLGTIVGIIVAAIIIGILIRYLLVK